eukprot:6174158-Pleurochrysis_carterae.AAC.2
MPQAMAPQQAHLGTPENGTWRRNSRKYPPGAQKHQKIIHRQSEEHSTKHIHQMRAGSALRTTNQSNFPI